MHARVVESDLYDDEDEKCLSVMGVEPDVLRRNAEQIVSPTDAVPQHRPRTPQSEETERLARSIVGVHLVVQRVSISSSSLSLYTVFRNTLTYNKLKLTMPETDY